MVRLFRKFPRGCGCTLHLQKLLLLKENPLQGCISPPDLWRLFSSKNPPQGCISHFQIHAAVLLKKSSSRLRLPPPDSCNCYPQMVRLSPDRTPCFSFLLLPLFSICPSLATSDGRHPRQSFLLFPDLFFSLSMQKYFPSFLVQLPFPPENPFLLNGPVDSTNMEKIPHRSREKPIIFRINPT